MELTQQLIDGLTKKTLFDNFEIKQKGNRGLFKGFASTWDLDEGGDRIIPGAFTANLSKFMENPVLLFSHMLDKVIGSWKHMEEQDKGLYGEAEINLKTQLGKDVYELVSDGDLKGLSIGYEIEDGATDKITGVRNLMKLKLWEVSIVAIPMNQNAWITGTKIFTGVDIPKEEKPEFKFKFKHKDSDLKFDDLAIDVYSLYEKSNDEREKIDAHLAKHYGQLEKKYPEFNDGKGIDEASLKDITFYEDEPHLYEKLRFNGSLETIINLAKHWQDEGRSQSEIEPYIAEALIKLNELLPQANAEMEANPVKDNESIDTIKKTIDDTMSKIAKITNFEAELKSSVKQMFSELVSKATGKEYK